MLPSTLAGAFLGISSSRKLNMSSAYYYTDWDTNQTWLYCENSYTWTCDCSTISADPDIAGIGVLIAFSLTALLALACSSIAVYIYLRAQSEHNAFDRLCLQLCSIARRVVRAALDRIRPSKAVGRYPTVKDHEDRPLLA